MMILERHQSVSLYDGNQSVQGLTPAMMKLGDDPAPKQAICPNYSEGWGQVSAAGSFDLDTPDGYLPASEYLFFWLRAKGTIALLISYTGVVGVQTVHLGGSTARPAVFSTTAQISAVQIQNPSAATVAYQWLMVRLPNIALESSFRGLQLTGDQTAGIS